MDILIHERLSRSAEVMQRLAALPVAVCGAGALGANICETLARTGFGLLRIIDRDRVEQRNLCTQPYQRADIGAYKAKILSGALYRAVGTQVAVRATELTADNAAELLAGSAVVLDTFDNSGSRQLVRDTCRQLGCKCLHAGLADSYAEVIWDEEYRVPSDANDDVCDYPLTRNLVLLATAVACEVLVGYAATGAQRSYTITLDDLAVRPY